jgi:DNA-binding transcriptional regulator GbsR (MarR family)
LLDSFQNLEELIKIVQFEQDLSLDEIAKTIGYSRAHLNQAKNNTNNEAIIKAIKTHYHGVIQHFVIRYANVYYQANKKKEEVAKQDIADNRTNSTVTVRHLKSSLSQIASELVATVTHLQDVVSKMPVVDQKGMGTSADEQAHSTPSIYKSKNKRKHDKGQ